MSNQSILVWDCSLVQSKGVDFVQKLSKTLKVSFSNIVVLTKDQKFIPPYLSDLSTAYNVKIRFGSNSTYDSLVDIVAFLTKCKCNCTFVLVSTNFPIWINLFQRAPPKSLVFVSTQDPRTSLDFSFLPSMISIQILQWPNLNELMAQSVHGTAIQQEIIEEEPLLAQNDIDIIDDNDGNDNDDDDDENDINNYIADNLNDVNDEDEDDGGEDSENHEIGNNVQIAASIQPLANIDKYQNSIDLRSPSVLESSTRNMNSSEITPKKPAQAIGPIISVPTKFQPLIESMKAIGKAMISLSDLEGQLRIWCNKLNEPLENTTTFIAKASDAGIIIYDKSINYVRFRNRSMANAQIEYV